MNKAHETVVVLGASPKEARYSNQAFKLLRQYGHEVIPVHPALDELEGVPVVKHLDDIDEEVDTVTVYVGEQVSKNLTDALIGLRPKRVIFNPGAENPELEQALDAEGIATEEACTLVLLNTGQF